MQIWVTFLCLFISLLFPFFLFSFPFLFFYNHDLDIGSEALVANLVLFGCRSADGR